jgi:hypothetical protein
VLVDANLAEADVIAFNAGTHKDVVYMRFADYRVLVRPEIHFFTRLPAVAGTAIPLDRSTRSDKAL